MVNSAVVAAQKCVKPTQSVSVVPVPPARKNQQQTAIKKGAVATKIITKAPDGKTLQNNKQSKLPEQKTEITQTQKSSDTAMPPQLKQAAVSQPPQVQQAPQLPPKNTNCTVISKPENTEIKKPQTPEIINKAVTTSKAPEVIQTQQQLTHSSPATIVKKQEVPIEKIPQQTKTKPTETVNQQKSALNNQNISKNESNEAKLTENHKSMISTATKENTVTRQKVTTPVNPTQQMVEQNQAAVSTKITSEVKEPNNTVNLKASNCNKVIQNIMNSAEVVQDSVSNVADVEQRLSKQGLTNINKVEAPVLPVSTEDKQVQISATVEQKKVHELPCSQTETICDKTKNPSATIQYNIKSEQPTNNSGNNFDVNRTNGEHSEPVVTKAADVVGKITEKTSARDSQHDQESCSEKISTQTQENKKESEGSETQPCVLPSEKEQSSRSVDEHINGGTTPQQTSQSAAPVNKREKSRDINTSDTNNISHSSENSNQVCENTITHANTSSICNQSSSQDAQKSHILNNSSSTVPLENVNLADTQLAPLDICKTPVPTEITVTPASPVCANHEDNFVHVDSVGNNSCDTKCISRNSLSIADEETKLFLNTKDDISILGIITPPPSPPILLMDSEEENSSCDSILLEDDSSLSQDITSISKTDTTNITSTASESGPMKQGTETVCVQSFNTHGKNDQSNNDDGVEDVNGKVGAQIEANNDMEKVFMKMYGKELSALETKYQEQVDKLSHALAEKQEELKNTKTEAERILREREERYSKEKLRLKTQLEEDAKKREEQLRKDERERVLKETAEKSKQNEEEASNRDNELEENRIKFEKLQMELLLMKQQNEEFEEIVREKHRKQMELELQVGEIHKEMREKEAAIERAKAELICAKNETEATKKKLKKLEEELDEYKDKVDKLEADLDNSERELKRMEILQEKLQDTESKRTELQKQLDEIELERDEEIKIIQEALDEAAMEREELLATFEKEMERINSLNTAREAQMLEDFEKKLKELEKEHQQKLKEKEREVESNMNRTKRHDDEETRHRLDRMKSELNSEWEDKCRSECARLKAELDKLHAEEKHLAVESMKVQKEHEMQTLRSSFDSKAADLNKEISTLKESLGAKDSFYRQELDDLRTRADRDVWELRRKLQKLDESAYDRQQLLEDKHREDIERLKEEYKDRIASMESQLSAVDVRGMTDLRANLERVHKEQMEHISEQHRLSMERLREELEAEKFQAAEDARVLVTKHHEYINTNLREQLAEAITANTQLRDEIDAIKFALSRREEVIRSLEEELSNLRSSRGIPTPAPQSNAVGAAASQLYHEDHLGSRNSQDSVDGSEEDGHKGSGLLGKVFGGGWFSGAKAKDNAGGINQSGTPRRGSSTLHRQAW